MSLTAGARLSLTELRAEVEQFYAEHFHLLDSGAAEEWAATFTVDGAFYPPHRPDPQRGRAALAEGAGKAHKDLLDRGERRRHWHGMVAVEPQADGTVHARCYALIVVTPPGGPTRPHLSCVCEDVFVREAGRLFVRERRVTRDDLR